MPSIISIKNLSKTYASGFRALKDIQHFMGYPYAVAVVSLGLRMPFW